MFHCWPEEGAFTFLLMGGARCITQFYPDLSDVLFHYC